VSGQGFRQQGDQDDVEERTYVTHVRRIGEEKLDDKGEKRYPARRYQRRALRQRAE
jgi:hypothetical protein